MLGFAEPLVKAPDCLLIPVPFLNNSRHLCQDSPGGYKRFWEAVYSHECCNQNSLYQHKS